ncbi:MAG: SDR family oxidoreductase [Candidatus Poribacteria bacterium]|nr:SDR family oxidoreductase [Candidatus Poribacteria bacterium]
MSGTAMDLSHDGRTVVISGGLRGIGRALAEGYLDAGANVVLFHRGASEDAVRAEDAFRSDHADLIRNGRARMLRADLTQKRDRSRVLSEAMDNYGRLDVVVDNAGVCYRDDLTPERIREQRYINATAPVRFAREAAEWLRKNDHASPDRLSRGAILGISSYVTEWKQYPSDYLRHYAQSKRLMERGLIKLALELRPCDINVNSIAVGVVYAGMGMATIGRKEVALKDGKLPVTKFAHVDAVVFEALCLTHPRAHYKTGRVETLDGGWNLGELES